MYELRQLEKKNTHAIHYNIMFGYLPIYQVADFPSKQRNSIISIILVKNG